MKSQKASPQSIGELSFLSPQLFCLMAVVGINDIMFWYKDFSDPNSM